MSKKNNEDFVIRGSGTPLRQFIYSEDLGLLIMKILESEKNEDNIILSVSEKDEISIKNIGFLIAKYYNYEDKIIFDKNFSDGQFKKTVSNEKLLNKFPDFKFTNIEVGIKNTVEWFIANQN